MRRRLLRFGSFSMAMKGAKFVSSVPQWSRVRVVREGSPEKALVKGGEDLDQVFDENEVEHR
jgi:hypothetical protein